MTPSEVRKNWKTCVKCEIGRLAFRKAFMEVFPPMTNAPKMTPVQPAVPTPLVDILMIGEGPGKSEDALGRPFIGASGQFLRDVIILAEPMDLSIGLTNLVLCRPCDGPGGQNRAPSPEEVNNCRPRLMADIEISDPLAIVCLGNVPQAYVPNMLSGIRWNGLIWYIKHPAAVLRHGGKQASYYSKYINDFRELFDKVRYLTPQTGAK